MKNQNPHHNHLVNKVKSWVIGLSILVHLSFYLIYAFVLEWRGEALDVFYAFGFHQFVLIAVIVYYFKIENAIIKAVSFFTAIFQIVCLGSFIIMGIFYDQPYFFYKAAFIGSILLFVAYQLIRKIIKYGRNIFI